jgi:hypothetical protein
MNTPARDDLENLNAETRLDTAEAFLTDYARALPTPLAAGERRKFGEFCAGMNAWLQPGLADHVLEEMKFIYSGADDGRPAGSLTGFWDWMSKQQPAMRLLAPVFARVLSIPASEADCKRIFSAMRRVLTPLSFRMDETTLFARLGRSMEGSGGFAPG